MELKQVKFVGFESDASIYVLQILIWQDQFCRSNILFLLSHLSCQLLSWHSPPANVGLASLYTLLQKNYVYLQGVTSDPMRTSETIYIQGYVHAQVASYLCQIAGNVWLSKCKDGKVSLPTSERDYKLRNCWYQ